MRRGPTVLGEPIPPRALIVIIGAALSAAMLRLTYPCAALLLGEDRGGVATGILGAVLLLGVLRGWLGHLGGAALRPVVFRALSRALRGAPLVGTLPRPEEIESTVARGAPWIESYFTITLPVVAGNLLALPVIVVLAASRLGWAVASLSLGAVAIGGFTAIISSRRAGELAGRAWNEYQPVATLLDGAIRARAELRAHGLDSKVEAELEERLRSWSRYERRAQLAASVTSFGVPTISIAAALAISAAAGAHPIAWIQSVVRSPSRDAVVGGFVLLSAIPTFVGLARGMADITLERRYLVSLDQFVKACTSGTAAARPALPAAIRRIEFDDVTFSYPPAARANTATVRAHFIWDTNQILAIVGPNGSGKTTVGWLVMGLLEPSSGAIRVHGVPGDATGTDTTSLAYLPQQPFWDAGATIRETVRFGAPTADDLTIASAIRALFSPASSSRIAAMLDHPVAALSGGERRLVALARTLLRNGDLVVLDEPEAGLDQDARHRVARLIAQQRGKARILLLTHDPIFIRLADQVLSFDAEHRLSLAPQPVEQAFSDA